MDTVGTLNTHAMTSYKHSRSATAIWETVRKRSIPEVEQWLWEFKKVANARPIKGYRNAHWTNDEVWLIKQAERLIAQHKGLKVSFEPIESEPVETVNGSWLLAEVQRRSEQQAKEEKRYRETVGEDRPRYRQRRYRVMERLNDIHDKEERVFWAKQRRAGL